MSMLFSPASVGSLALRNRLVRSATAEMLADDTGRPTEKLADLYRELARGGVGLIVSGHMFVHPGGKAHPQMTGIHDDDLIPDLQRLADAVHLEGGRIAAQINHAGRQTRSDDVEQPIGPSDEQVVPPGRGARAMTLDEIEATIDSYAQAARRAVEARFDAVQIHAAHGYLVSQFLSPLANRRNDEWGGNLENRTRFLDSVARACREAIGPNVPLLIKLGLRDEAPNGLDIEEGADVVSRLAGFGIDAVELSGGVAETAGFNILSGIEIGIGEAYFRPWAKRAQPATDLPVILVGGFRSAAVMEEVLESGDAQFISMCRPFICEPDLPDRLAAGQPAASCVSKNRCWPRRRGEGISCKCRGVDRPQQSPSVVRP
ncbi:NADH:flavin oxidoreductase [Candidatus Bipolaricaulota bacterium]|nr:NADH:flavin oxidoreductase [Candidatus Bipolaricaulota bacterium]